MKMGIYHNIGKKTMAAIKQELGASFICNLNLFDMTKFTGNCFTKAAGKIVGNDGAVYPVLAWNTTDGKMTSTWSNSVAKYEHAFGCLDLVKDANYCVTAVPSWASGSRQRTAIGIKANGDIVVYCNQANVTIKTVANELIKQGCMYAINVDGGGSTQCMTNTSSLKSSRIVHTLFYVIETEEVKPITTTPNITMINCPYTEPTVNIRQGSSGDGAKWVQWYLNKHGANLTVDGIFGAKSVAALVAFQKASKIAADGICGTTTRKYLKMDKTAQSAEKAPQTQSLIDKAVDFGYSQLGSEYVFGAQGEMANDGKTIDWSARCFPSYTTPNRAKRMKQYAKDNPKLPNGLPLKLYDCSGFVLCCIEAAGIHYADTTAAGIYQNLARPIKKSELREGDIVLTEKLDHIAIVGRNGEILEAAGSDVGCVKTSSVDDRKVKSIYGAKYGCNEYYTKSPWTKFGRLKCFE